MESRSLELYLESLGIDRSLPSLSLVEAMQRAHVALFSFNSVGVVLGRPLPLDLGALVEKIVKRGEGGYCFEHNKLFFLALKELGFEVRLALGRVLLNRDIDLPLTHRVTILTHEGCDYLVDVGFGSMSLRMPMRLDSLTDTEQDGFIYRILKSENGDYLLQTVSNGEDFTLYSFNLVHYTDADCELGHFYSSKHPDAVFVNNLVVSRILATEVRSLRNLVYRVFDADGFEDTAIVGAEQLGGLLEDAFGMPLSSDECRRLFEVAAKADGAG